MRSSLLNLLKRQLVYIVFDGEISSGYDALACMPDAKKGEDDKSNPRTLSTPAARANCAVVYTQRIGCSISLFRLSTIT